MNRSSFESLCTELFESLFGKVKSIDEVKFLTNFFPFYEQYGHKIMSYIPDYEFSEVIDLIKNLHITDDKKDIDNQTKTRIRLFVYCHIMEVDYVYMVIFNMLRTIHNVAYSPQITYLTKKGKIKIAEYPSEKIELILKESQKASLDFKSIFDKIWDCHLRNAFSHSQYFLLRNGDLEISKYLAPTSPQFMKSGKTSYLFSEISNIYENSRKYLLSFIKSYDKFIKPYSDGITYKTIYGPILFDKDHGWGFYQGK